MDLSGLPQADPTRVVFQKFYTHPTSILCLFNRVLLHDVLLAGFGRSARHSAPLDYFHRVWPSACQRERVLTPHRRTCEGIHTELF